MSETLNCKLTEVNKMCKINNLKEYRKSFHTNPIINLIWYVGGMVIDGSLSDTALGRQQVSGSRRKTPSGSSPAPKSSSGMGKKSSSTSQLSATGICYSVYLYVKYALCLGMGRDVY